VSGVELDIDINSSFLKEYCERLSKKKMKLKKNSKQKEYPITPCTNIVEK